MGGRRAGGPGSPGAFGVGTLGRAGGRGVEAGGECASPKPSSTWTWPTTALHWTRPTPPWNLRTCRCWRWAMTHPPACGSYRHQEPRVHISRPLPVPFPHPLLGMELFRDGQQDPLCTADMETEGQWCHGWSNGVASPTATSDSLGSQEQSREFSYLSRWSCPRHDHSTALGASAGACPC